MRWVALTPTFAAGLGVVVAAAMAVPAHTVQLTTMPRSQPCATPGCVSGAGKGSTAARPGSKRLATPSRARASHAAAGQHAAVSAAAPHVRVQYRTLGQDGNGDFTGQLILASRTAQPLSNWVLQFSYPGQIRVVWGRPPLPPGQHSVTVTGGQYPSAGSGWAGWSNGRIVQIVFSVSGQPRQPASCTINGQRCHYVSSLPGESPGGGYGSGSGYGHGGYAAYSG